MRAVAAITQKEGREDCVDYHQPNRKSRSGSKKADDHQATHPAEKSDDNTNDIQDKAEIHHLVLPIGKIATVLFRIRIAAATTFLGFLLLYTVISTGHILSTRTWMP
jgi:hypothetical protein